ncbi:MAG: site-specific integrase [Sphingomonadales bacterium]|nr:site-specific integrase [Sphingomonadales bacterium]MBD3771950.1 site-specific integrase [Paracoccaceae bacterium]
MADAGTIQLTKRVIDAAEPREKHYDLWDSELAGFGIRIGVGGSKTFFIRYRAEGGGRKAPRRHVTIGRYGAALTVDQARRKAKSLLAQAMVGGDPAKERNDKRREMRVDELIDLYDKEGCYIQRGKRQGEPMKSLTKKYTMARLRHHVVPLLGRKRVSEIGAPEIERFFRDVENGKTAKNEKTGPRTRIIVKGGNGAARKVFRDFSAVLSFAMRFGVIESHPCEKAVVKKTDNARTRFLSMEELRRFGAACDALEAEGANPKALNIARLWALTGCRRQEIVELKWSEVDFDNGLMTLADTKTGQSIRPLPIAAMVLLRSIERAEGTEYVFPADTGESFFQGTKTIWQKIVKRADLPGVTPHTLRHTVGAIATSNGEALALTGAILGHSNLRSTMIYAHVDWDPSVKAANRVSDRISSALAGEDEQSSTRRSDSPSGGKAPPGGLLPPEEWDMLLDLADADPNTRGRLSSKDNGVLLRLSRHGFAEKVQDLADELAWWRITALGRMALRQADTRSEAA